MLPSLQNLYLYDNQTTDEGCTALASALRGGALPALKQLWLEGNPAVSQQATAEVQAVLDARSA